MRDQHETGRVCNTAMTRRMMKKAIASASTLIGVALLCCARPGLSAEINDYPTAARADYVFACMKVNSETEQALRQCSCSIDVVATLIPYERYVDAETVIRMRQVPGHLGNVFRATEFSKKVVDDLRRAQAEAEIRCF